MDKYLNIFSSSRRLQEEFDKYSNLVIAVDFDDTLYDFHKEGNSYEFVKQLVRELKEIGCYIIIWTGNQDTEFVKAYLAENNIPYDSINEDAPSTIQYLYDRGHKPIARKLYANAYLDDRAGLLQTFTDLQLLINYAKSKREVPASQKTQDRR